MTQYAVLYYFYYSKISQAPILYTFFHKLTWIDSRLNISVLVHALKVGLENMS